MPPRSGTFIAIEEQARSGMAAQAKLLADSLSADGYDVVVAEFPQASSPSSHFVEAYSNEAYGPPESLSPYTCALFYALDRYEAARHINQALSSGKVVIVRNFVGSTMAQQGIKFSNQEERRGFYIWLDNMEFHLLGTPRPDRSFVLLETPKTAEHPATSVQHNQSGIAGAFADLCQLFPKDFTRIDNERSGQYLDEDAIFKQLMAAVQPLLPVRNQPASGSITVLSGDLQNTPSKNSMQTRLPADWRKDVAQHTPRKPRYLPGVSYAHAARLGLISTPPDVLKPGKELAFFTPKHLNAVTSKAYTQTTTHLVNSYKQVRKKLESRLAADKQNKLGLVQRRLIAHQAARILLPASLIAPLVLADADLESVHSAIADMTQTSSTHNMRKDSSPGKTRNSLAISDIAEKHISDTYGGEHQAASLTSYFPRNELHLISSILYEHTMQPLSQIERELDAWPIGQKQDMLKMFLKDSRATLRTNGPLQQVQYRWECMNDSIELCELASYIPKGSIIQQPLTPRYGYKIPDLAEAAGLSDLFEASFDISLKLYSVLQASGYADWSQCAVLLGHRVRWSLSLSAADILRLQKSLHEVAWFTPFYRSLVDGIAEVHPLIGEALYLDTKS